MEAGFSRVLDCIRLLVVRPVTRLLPAFVTPNGLTFLRLALVAPLGLLLWHQAWIAALCVYLVAIFTDALDGELARLHGTMSRFGSRLDPTVDKILHGVIFLLLFPFAPLLFSTVLALDGLLLLIGLLVLITSRAPKDLSANTWGKWKFILQTLAVVLLFAYVLTQKSFFLFLAHGTLSAAIIFAVCSLFGYVKIFFRTTTKHIT